MCRVFKVAVSNIAIEEFNWRKSPFSHLNHDNSVNLCRISICKLFVILRMRLHRNHRTLFPLTHAAFLRDYAPGDRNKRASAKYITYLPDLKSGIPVPVNYSLRPPVTRIFFSDPPILDNGPRYILCTLFVGLERWKSSYSAVWFIFKTHIKN